MTRTHDVPKVRSARHEAELAARQRLLNSFLAETGRHDPRAGTGTEFRIELSASSLVLCGTIEHWSVMGHHVYGEEMWLRGPGTVLRSTDQSEVTSLVLAEFAEQREVPRTAIRRELAAQIDNSVERVTRYLTHRPAPRPGPDRPHELTRHAEQSLLFGHPLHPTPKSAEGFNDGQLVLYAPEMGASFELEYFAVAPEILREQSLAPDVKLPADVVNEARAVMSPETARVSTLLPVHPWQADYLRRHPTVQDLISSGVLVPLGPLGRAVYPTSSVRTVCDPEFGTAWKLPLHVRITNFIRTNPLEHAKRAMDASRLVAACRRTWDHPGFEVLIETGTRGLAVPELAADTTVLFRENPFALTGHAPLVVASLLEPGRQGEEPHLIHQVREAGGVPTGPLPPAAVGAWLERYLKISLLPLLEVFDTTGISLEAHVQNSLVHLEGGWPTRFYVRDMEGVSLSRCGRPLTEEGRAVPSDSSLLYEHAEAWHRLQYYAVTNHFGHLIHVLARHGNVDEQHLWSTLGQALRNVARRYNSAHRLLTEPTLPYKANLSSRFAGTSENPNYAAVPNPLCEVSL